MTTADLADLAAALRRFERDARNLSAAISPLLREGASFNAEYNDTLPAAVSAALHRVNVVLTDAVAIVGSANFDLLAQLAAR